jgi:S-adenosylmethionine:tRNA ribosyltransferase-isomerase
MRVDAFDFELPTHLIAQHPALPRDAARLLHVGPGGLADRQVRDLPDLLRPGDLLVFNDTRVIPARLIGRRGEAQVEVTLLEPLLVGLPGSALLEALSVGLPGSAPLEPKAAGHRWRALARPARKCRTGDRIRFAEDFAADVLARGEGGEVLLVFSERGEAFRARLERHGIMPLPPYIIRPKTGDPRDRTDYQTLFARRDGAVAAPTAALHFTASLMARLEARGIGTAFVTLHVGAGTFFPVKTQDTDDHVMHRERFEVGAEAASRIMSVRRSGGRVVAVGTTVLRTLESVAADDATIRAGAGTTRLFITPGYRFRAADLLMTNFHLPRSTLFMLVAAFAGLERMHGAYRHAIEHGYRFYSYGDACLLERAG